MHFIFLLTVILIKLSILYINNFCSGLTLSFAKNVDNKYQIFRTFIPVTIQTCRDECERRPRCVAAAYHRRYSLCGLASRQDTQTNAQGVTILAGNKVNLPCGDRVCSYTETCVYNGIERVCRVTECIEPERKFPTFFGNNFTVGSSIVYKGIPHGIDLQRTCLENGEWSLDKTRMTQDCFDVTGPSGVYWQPVLGIAIFCDLHTDGGKWMVFQRRQDGSVDFYRNWETYETGFGDLHGEFWMGLATIHTIVSNSHYELRIDMENFQGEYGYAKYSTFSVSGPEKNYVLTVEGFTGDRGDSLTEWHNGFPFTTFDRENDYLAAHNCAERFRGGWWYSRCHHANLNGLYSDGKTTWIGRNIHWRTWTTYTTSLKKTSMKLRRKLSTSGLNLPKVVYP